MIYGYIRVSTDKQETANQKYQIENFALKNNLGIDIWVEETISSMVKLEKRQLNGLLIKMQKGDLMIACELSRLGRNLMQIMSILHGCLNKEVQIWTIKDNYRLGNDISSKVLAFAFGLSAEIERNLISQRTKEALQRRKAEGQVLGRPMGSSTNKSKIDKQEGKIKHYLERGLGYSAIARLLKCHRLTVSNFCISKGLRVKKHSAILPVRKHPGLDLSGCLQMYASGMSVNAIAEHFELSQTSLVKRLKEEGFYDNITAISNQKRIEHPSKRSMALKDQNHLKNNNHGQAN